MGGLIHTHPSLGIVLFILTLSIGGVPPFSGFPGKLLIIQGALAQGYVAGVVVMIITSLIAMYSLLRVFFYMYFGREGMPVVQKQTILPHKIAAMLLLTIATIVMGFGAEWFLDIAHQAAEMNLNPGDYQEAVVPHLEVD